MSSFFQEVFSLLTTPPGNLVYHLILSFAIVGSLQAAIFYWKKSDDPRGRRMVIGLVSLLVIRLLIFLFAGLAWQGIFNTPTILPPIDRAVNIISLIILIWLWTFPLSLRIADIGAILGAFIALILGFLTLSFLTGQSYTGNFNASILDLGWAMITLALALFGGILLFIRKPMGWGYGFVFLVILFLADFIHIFSDFESDFSGISRIGHIAAYPLLFIITQRFESISKREQDDDDYDDLDYDEDDEPEDDETKPSATELKRQNALLQQEVTESNTFLTYLNLAIENDPQEICMLVTQAIGKTIVADLSLLVAPQENTDQIILLCGYDLIREESLGGLSMDASIVPRLSSAIRKNKALRLPASSKSQDMEGLSQILGLPEIGSLLAVPIVREDNNVIASIVLLTPYSKRGWTQEDQTYIEKATPALAKILQGPPEKEEIKDEEHFEPQVNFEELILKNEQLQLELEEISDNLKLQQTIVANYESGAAAAEDNDSALRILETENIQLIETIERLEETKQTPIAMVADGEEAINSEKELNEALAQVQTLQDAIAVANKKITNLQSAPKNVPRLSDDHAEVIASIAQELRQPMSSISGYTDLLLSESVGILGALQRKFLDRVKTSTDRVTSMIDQVVQITTMETGSLKLTPEPVNLSVVIDETINSTSNQMREKEIILRVDLPEELPSLNTDKDALQQILLHLFQNAGAATPVDGEISVRATVDDDNNAGDDYVLVQVTDSGGGIPEEELPRVFSRLYRADNPLIQGVGDTGVGLSIAKALTEALGGRIWVDSDIGYGATFSILLPISQQENSFNGRGEPSE